MKKVLFATTALIALGSMAAADVRLSGYGRFGLDYNDFNSTDVNSENYNGVSETTITSRLRLQVDMSTETDGGVGFNARVRMQAESRDNQSLSNGGPRLVRDATGAVVTRPDAQGNDVPIVVRPNDNGFNGARFGVTFEGLTVNVGNIIGAVENAPGLYTTGTRSAGTGIDGMGFNSLVLKDGGWDAYTSDGQGVNGIEVLYTISGFTGHISYSEDNDDLASFDPVVGLTVPGEKRLGLMATYAFGDYYVTGAYQDASDGAVIGGDDLNDLWLLAAGGDWGQWGARIAYGQTTLTKSWTLEGNVDIGAASNLLIWVNDASSNKSVDIGGTPTDLGTDGTSYGINYQYDLGGGATFVAGYVRSENSLAIASRQKQNQFQAGVYFSF